MTDWPSFEDYFTAIHGNTPYAWQKRLAQDIAERGVWPDALAAPTGAGKTAVLDIALWNLARSVQSEKRSAPLRIVFAVNRRVIVDQAFDRASHIATKLAAADSGCLVRVRDALATLSGDVARPLHVEQLRGGLPREDDWARTPCQPTILCTTVDQLGSRLLFRGYGVSNRMAPIHAGLLGNDALILLDEAHLSDAFSETLKCVKRWREDAEEALARPFMTCRMTATPRPDDAAFVLTDEERKEDAIHRRLRALKRAELRKINATETDEVLQGFVKAALELAAADPSDAPVIAVIVNRVASARSIYEHLRAIEPVSTGEADAILLTGRIRPVDRDRLMAEYRDDLSGNRRKSGPMFVVATQTIEAGADFDFDGMVSQIAPLDALIQRFGRLARRGNRREDVPSEAVILAPKNDIAARTDDPVYGKTMMATWNWLFSKAISEGRGRTRKLWLYFGPDAIATTIATDPEGASNCMSAREPSPLLRKADAEYLSVTSPMPDPDPDIGFFLHGRMDVETDVSIVWRSDLSASDLRGDAPLAPEIVSALKPTSAEALAVPVWQARRWLRPDSATKADIADIPGKEPEDMAGSKSRAFVLMRGGNPPIVSSSTSDVRPGDTLVVPSEYGGCDRFGWHPQSEEPVQDIADTAAEPFRQTSVRLRVHPYLWLEMGLSDAVPWAEVSDILSNRRLSRSIAGDLLQHLDRKVDQTEVGKGAWLSALRVVADRATANQPIQPYGNTSEDKPIGTVLVAGLETVQTGEDDASSHTLPEDLNVHATKVRDKVTAFAKTLKLSHHLTETLKYAGHWHDDGKADERFQQYLHSFVGSEWEGRILAKTGAGTGKKAGQRQSAGLPSGGWRHEVLSVQLAIAKQELFPEHVDRALAIWLIGTHHGYGRPFFRHEDPWDGLPRRVLGVDIPTTPGPHRLEFEWDDEVRKEPGFDWPHLFVRLKQRYGIWGLAFLEAVLRLADHRASEDSALLSLEPMSTAQ